MQARFETRTPSTGAGPDDNVHFETVKYNNTIMGVNNESYFNYIKFICYRRLLS